MSFITLYQDMTFLHPSAPKILSIKCKITIEMHEETSKRNNSNSDQERSDCLEASAKGWPCSISHISLNAPSVQA